MNIIQRIFGTIACKIYSLQANYNNQEITALIGGGKRYIQYPFHISGANSIIAEEPINIGVGSTLMTGGRAIIRIKRHFVSGPGLTIITGDHMPIVGRFLDTVSNEDKDKFDKNRVYDQDVTIEEDIWCGANVTILKGVTLGRGSIIAAGSVVTKSMPPYCIIGGVPARPLKMKWSVAQILEHEKQLYTERERIDKSELERIKQSFE